MSVVAEEIWNTTLAHEPPSRELASPPRSLRQHLLSRQSLHNLPALEPLIENTIDKRSVNVLVGHRGSGKTFIGLDWACSVATGRAWQGRPVEQGPALMVFGEGAHGLPSRFSAWEEAWHREVNDLDVLPVPVNLTRQDDLRELVALAHEKPYALIVIDTLARCAVGADENSARDMGLVVEAAYQIRGGSAAAILFVHHTGKDRETTRGSSALEAGVDTVYLAEGDAAHLTLTRTKRKDGPLDDRLNLRLAVTGESCTVESHGGGHDHHLRTNATRLLSIYMSTFKETGASKAELRTAAGEAGIKSSSSFSRALGDLLKSGELSNEATDQRPFYRAPSKEPTT